MRIFVDATGGDLAPQAPVEGTVEALRRNPELTVTLVGALVSTTGWGSTAGRVAGALTLDAQPDSSPAASSPANRGFQFMVLPSFMFIAMFIAAAHREYSSGLLWVLW